MQHDIFGLIIEQNYFSPKIPKFLGSKGNNESIQSKILRFANRLTIERKQAPRSRERETRRFALLFVGRACDSKVNLLAGYIIFRAQGSDLSGQFNCIRSPFNIQS